MGKNTWKASEIRQLMHGADARAVKGRLERLGVLFRKQDLGPFPTPALVYEYYEEARLCWYTGAFVATILMAQLAFEELFRAHYRGIMGVGGKLTSGKKVDNAGFRDLIQEAEKDGWISGQERKALQALRRELRNPYVHTRDTKVGSDGKVDPKEPSFLTQTLKLHAPELVQAAASDEAECALKLLVTLLPEISRRSGGF